MKILVIGRGGRESAIVKKIIKSNMVSEVYIAPGNYQTGMLNKCQNVNILETNVQELQEFAFLKQIDLTIVGPESSLELGIVNKFQAKNLQIFGPTKEACLIETSKSFAKNFMKKYHIPTAAYQEFSEVNKAITYAKNILYPHVIKYDGLAAGKGVVICHNFEQMQQEIKNMLEDNSFGHQGKIILEEYLEGEEFTLLSLVKDDKVYPLEISRDYKRTFDNDQGLNTGGMGAICPFDKIDAKTKEEAVNILQATAQGLMQEKKNFTGVLYGGFIATTNGVKVIEYNARFGDPETEVVLQKLANDLVKLILDILNEQEIIIQNNNKYYVGITLAAKGYPQNYQKGILLNSYDDNGIFHMGTTKQNHKLVSNGGRVLFVSASGNTLKEARIKAYEKIELFQSEQLFYRKDIGK